MTKFFIEKTCDTCGKRFDTTSTTVNTCGSCQHNKNLVTAREKKAYHKLLEARDTVADKIKTIKTQSTVTGKWRRYIYCPSCELLCNDDTFCRYCGKRLRLGSELADREDD